MFASGSLLPIFVYDPEWCDRDRLGRVDIVTSPFQSYIRREDFRFKVRQYRIRVP